MDPLSVTASIVGLLGATAKVSALVICVNGAPSLMQDVLSQISDIRMSLGQLQSLLFGPEEKFRSRAALLMVEDLIALLTNAVVIFSELEKVMEEFKNDESLQFVSRVKLSLKEPIISKLLLRLQSSKASLSLMLTMLTCSSVGAAQASERQLSALVQQLLESNQEISSRLAKMEMRGLSTTAASSVASTSREIDEIKDDSSTIRPKTRVSNSSREIRIENTDNAGDLIQGFGFTFDQELKSSRVYMRFLRRNPTTSCSSSIASPLAWSFLSGLSLADISNISMLSLPISPNELSNAQHYSFGTTHSLPPSSIEPQNARDYTPNNSKIFSISSLVLHRVSYFHYLFFIPAWVLRTSAVMTFRVSTSLERRRTKFSPRNPLLFEKGKFDIHNRLDTFSKGYMSRGGYKEGRSNSSRSRFHTREQVNGPARRISYGGFMSHHEDFE